MHFRTLNPTYLVPSLHALANLSLLYLWHILKLRCTYFHFILCPLEFGPLLSLTHEITHAASFTYSSFLTTKFSLLESKIHLNVVLCSHRICLRFLYLSVFPALCLFTKQVAQTAKLLMCILGVFNVNLCQDSFYPSKVLFEYLSLCRRIQIWDLF